MKFELNEIETKNARNFLTQHQECEWNGENPPAIGGKFSYIFTRTGIGTAVCIRCNCCGVMQEITDTSKW